MEVRGGDGESMESSNKGFENRLWTEEPIGNFGCGIEKVNKENEWALEMCPSLNSGTLEGWQFGL